MRGGGGGGGGRRREKQTEEKTDNRTGRQTDMQQTDGKTY